MPLRYHNGDTFGFTYNGEEYYYIKNVQNDIVAIADKNGTVVANYYYDAWGNVTQITGNTALAQTNPLRYRSSIQNAAGVGLQSTWATIEYPLLQGRDIIYGVASQSGSIQIMP